MKLTNLVNKKLVGALRQPAEHIVALYDLLDELGFDYADDIIDGLVDTIATDPKLTPVIDFCVVNTKHEKFTTDITAEDYLGYNVNHYQTTLKKQDRTVTVKINGYKPEQIKLALSGLIQNPITVKVNLATIQNSGEYQFMRGTTLASEDELHFPIGIKPFVEHWHMVHDPKSGYLVRQGINDMAEAREVLTNTLGVEDSTTLAGLELWLSIMGDVTPPAGLGNLWQTIKTKDDPYNFDADGIADYMPLWMNLTTGMQMRPPRFIKAKRPVRKATLEKTRLDIPEVDDLEVGMSYDGGVVARKRIDLRRNMVNRTVEQGVQDSLAVAPLENALQAQFPLWLLMADKQEIAITKANQVTHVSVAADIGQEIANLKSIVAQQMKIAHAKGSTDKQKSAAMARATQTSRQILQLRKDAGYFEQNNATKAGIFQNTDQTVLQDDGAAFDSLIEQLAQEQGND